MIALLAAGKSGSPIIGVVVVALWLIFSLISAMARKQEQQRREQLRQKLGASLPRVAQAPILPLRQVRTVAHSMSAALQAAAKPGTQPRKAAQLAKARVATRGAAAATAPTKQDVSRSEIGSAQPLTPRPAVNAAALHAWLRPATLRQQFILTEVLQPPLALREH